jgi:hypothetical protein
LREPDFNPEQALRRVLGLAERAPALAVSGEAGFERYAATQEARAARAKRKRELRAPASAAERAS